MLDNLRLAVSGAWRVLLAGLIFGAGVPAVFALGIRALAIGGAADPGGRIRPIGKIFGTMCFALVVVAIVLGITFIVAKGFGKELNFGNVYPTLVDK